MASQSIIELSIFKIVNYYENLNANNKTIIDMSRNNKLQSIINKISVPKSTAIPSGNTLLQYILRYNDKKLVSNLEKVHHAYTGEELLTFSMDERISFFRKFITNTKILSSNLYLNIVETFLKTNNDKYFQLLPTTHNLYPLYQKFYIDYDRLKLSVFRVNDNALIDLFIMVGEKHFHSLSSLEQEDCLRNSLPEPFTSFLNNYSFIYENCKSMTDLQYIFYKIARDGSFIPNISLSHFYDERLINYENISSQDLVEFDENTPLGYIFSDLIEQVKKEDNEPLITIENIIWNIFSVTLFDWEIDVSSISPLTLQKTIQEIQKSSIVLHNGLLNIVYRHTTMKKELFQEIKTKLAACDPSSPKLPILKVVYKNLLTHQK